MTITAERSRRLVPHVPRTVPARIMIYTVAAVVAVIALFAAISSGLGNARDGLRVVGHDAGPQVVHTGDLYFALSDMDAQLASILLIGKEHDLGIGRDNALRTYEDRRRQADSAVLQAFDIAGKDAAGQKTVQQVLDGMGKYEKLASEAMVLNEQSKHAAGPPSEEVLEVYRRATDQMSLDLLPKAYNLTLESASIVRQTYAAERSHVLRARAAVAVAGAALLAALIGLQLYLGRSFRRSLNPALVLATVLTLILASSAMVVLASTSSHLRDAKEDGFNGTLDLARARAISNNAAADQTRYLLDPKRRDTYEQVYLDKSQAIAYVPAGNLAMYYEKLAGTVPELGFIGRTQGTTAALDGYRAVQRQDQRMRQLARDDKIREAIELRAGLMVDSFRLYDDELSKLVTRQRVVFDNEITDGDGALNGWNRGLPAAALVLVALIVLGVRPRLAEFR